MNSQSTCENGMNIRRIEDKGIPVEYSKQVSTAMCGSGELKNCVRLTVTPHPPIVMFTDPLATCENDHHI